ncbi:MAG: hypothetical protein LBJ21_05740 [Acidobacteriota bacterium]|jgi:general secretion pathway protein D|nr:hypothetical protein [Acidobacteriota bacterium]
MFIRNRKLRSLIFLACAATMTAQPAAWGAQGGAQRPPDRSSAAARSANEIPVRFTNADMNEFVSTMAELLGLKPIMVDSLVQGVVDFSITIPRNELWSLFHGTLRTKSAALVYQDNIYQVIPLAAAIRGNLKIIDEQPLPRADGEPYPDISQFQPPAGQEFEQEGLRALPVATHVVRLDFMSVDDVVDAVRLLLSDSVAIITFKRLNMMIFTDYSDNAARVREIIRLLDNSFFNPDNVELVKIEYSNAVDVAAELGVIFGSGAGAAPAAKGGAVSSAATGVSFVPLERLNSIFVMAASRHALATAKRWIGELDASENNKYQTYVYVVQDSTASNIATMLLALYGDGNSSSNATGTSRNTSSSSSLINQALGLGNDSSGSTFGSATQLGPRLDTSSPTVTSIVLGGSEFGGLRDIARVVVDDINNVLRVQSTPADYRTLLKDIEEMDAPPRQVSIEAMVLQVDLTDELMYGFRAWLEARSEGKMTTAGMGSGSVDGALSFETFAYIGSQRQLMLALDALKSKNKVNILQQPSVTTMDGNQATFITGAEVPYQSGSYFTSDLGQTTISYRKTGVSLIVIPKISASGTVTMEIAQEVSTFSSQSVGGTDVMIFPTTNVETVLSVKDGQTAVIAGLRNNQDIWNRAGIPFLSDIPFIGGLFGGTYRKNTRTELVILITPHVIRTPERLQEFTQRFSDSLRNVRKLADEQEAERIRDIENARKDREKRELDQIRDIRKVK